nr:pseudouridine synthase [Brachybacterium muris]
MPQRDGLDPVRHRVARDAAQGIAFDSLLTRFPALGDPEATPLHERFVRGEIVRADGTAWAADAPVEPGDELWFHRELREEAVPEMDLPILHQDDHLLVVDKPHDMATMPRGTHVLSSALVRLRRSTGITTLSPLHRLDRRTAGVLAFGVDPAERSAYQELFARREVLKEYLARVGPYREGAAVPADLPTMVGARTVLRDRLVKERDDLLTRLVAGEPNAITEVEVAAVELDGTLTLRLRPLTGRTHQLRAQLASRGMPIVGEDLYPTPRDPVGSLQLLARSLAFTDPVTGQERRFTSALDLPGPPS